MYLKSIEVQGFKSFANKIIFEFHNGITGIVGPNGSGKSNVADAVRWVLGEQKVKQLRSSSMQDVIFSGTETRKPQGFAYVAITLDNSDHKLPVEFDEVTVSRRIYRSGESEYLLNKSPCRLRDINELFYDTGIGKEGYSIIGQGQIDKILSGRPEERRELFDEAAGIVKFKRRKAVAQKKLEDEKQNLVRISDILSELEKQVGPLSRQAETAREYLRLREELKRLEANLFLTETEAAEKELKELKEKSSIAAGDMEESQKQAGELKAGYERLTEEIRQLETEITGGRNAANEALMKAQTQEGRIDVLNEQIRAEEMNAEHIRNRILAVDAELAGKEEMRIRCQTERDGTSGRLLAAERELKAATEHVSRSSARAAGLEQTLEEGKAALIGALNKKSELSVKKQRYDTMLEQVQVRRSEVAQRLLKLKSDEEGWDIQIQGQEAELSAIAGEIEGHLALEKRQKEQIHTSETELQRLNRALNDTQQEYHMAHTKYESLRNLAERYEGYGNSIRRVMEVRSRINGIHGVVADLFDVPKQYETAIETALGGSIQNIVTDTEETAKELIGYLKKNQYGRATFLPLTGISGRQEFSRPEALKEPGVIGIADTLVSVKEEYRALTAYLLGRVLVADTIDHAIAIARKYRHSLRIVTLEGELLSPGGSMSGGAFKNSSNLLGRRREMEELEAACKKALMTVDTIQQKQVGEEKALEAGKRELSVTGQKLQECYLKENTARVNVRQLLERKGELSQSSSDLKLEHGQLEEQLRSIRESIDRVSDEIRLLESANADRNAALAETGRLLETVKSEREEAGNELSRIQLRVSELRQQDSFAEQNLERLSEESEKLLQEKESLAGGTEKSRQAIGERLLQIEELKREIIVLRQEEASVRSQTEAALAAREEKSAGQRTLFARQEEISGRISNLDKELFRLQNQKEKLEEKRDSFVDYMWSEYELTFSGAAALRDDSLTSVPDIRRQAGEQKGKIRALGNVNVNAIEDYRELSERHAFMKGQHDDLTAAQDALLKIIDELDTGMRKQFAEKFDDIRREFDKVFKELFGGGHGTLELMEDEDILEAGIQIISQPPGKKLQNMMQMSGGEKALTAIALLFAIQNLKPSPFCLLDEIEAALDDSNVDRYAKYLHKLTEHTQFIIITHRRGTMVAADRLYGITMQEKGVSTLVSVNLIEEELG